MTTKAMLKLHSKKSGLKQEKMKILIVKSQLLFPSKRNRKYFLQSKPEILKTNEYQINEKVSPEHKVNDYYEFNQK